MWQHLTVLQYLSAADGALPSEEWIAMAELPEGGLIRGASFDREIDDMIAEEIGCHSSEQITEASAHLGGKLRENARADLSFEFSFRFFNILSSTINSSLVNSLLFEIDSKSIKSII